MLVIHATLLKNLKWQMSLFVKLYSDYILKNNKAQCDVFERPTLSAAHIFKSLTTAGLSLMGWYPMQWWIGD